MYYLYVKVFGRLLETENATHKAQYLAFLLRFPVIGRRFLGAAIA
jgi:hypothetical protein